MQRHAGSPPIILVSLIAFSICVSDMMQASTAAETWDDAFGRLTETSKWEYDEAVDCTATPKEFEDAVRTVLTGSNPNLKIIDIEFNNKQKPRVLVGIRCAPVHYEIDVDGGALVGGDGRQLLEITQIYVQLLESEAGRNRFRVLRRSAQHPRGNLMLQPLQQQPPNGKQTALAIKERLVTALSNLRTASVSPPREGPRFGGFVRRLRGSPSPRD